MKKSRNEQAAYDGAPVGEPRSGATPGVAGSGNTQRAYFPKHDNSPAEGPFKVIRSDIRSDGRGRVTIGQGVIGDTQYRALLNKSGQIILDPVITVPAREFWLLQNPEALASVARGVQQAQRGELENFPSFAEFVDDDTAGDTASKPPTKARRRRRKGS